MRWRLSIPLLGVAALGCRAGGPPSAEPLPPTKACSEIGCENGLELELVRPGGWPPGRYRITLRVDDVSTTCEGELPLGPCEQGPSFRCSDAALSVAESGCALPAAEHAISGLRSRASEAESVSLVIEHDGALQATAKLTPTFRTLQPNGPGCEPVCRAAAMKLTMR